MYFNKLKPIKLFKYKTYCLKEIKQRRKNIEKYLSLMYKKYNA